MPDPKQGVPAGEGRKPNQIRELQQFSRKYHVRPGVGRATSHTPAGTFLTSTKRPTERGNSVPTSVLQASYWA